ncbi:MAG: Lacal_2735 family protein [Bacteroidetes bacterium]|nr:Lacal_2735 family protein [Bacteroidota bacterium]
MLNFFKRKSPLDRLYQQHKKLLKEAHALSTTNRAASDAKYAEADALMTEIEAVKPDQ